MQTQRFRNYFHYSSFTISMWRGGQCQLRCLHSNNRELSAPEDSSTRLSFENEYKSHYIPTNLAQKFLLSTGSAILSLLDPSRADTIATFGEASGSLALRKMRDAMARTSEGAAILQEKPRINSKTVDLKTLAGLPSGTLGASYIKFLEENNVTPDSRLPVQFVDDCELAYVMQRYREIHDLIHTVLGMPTNMQGEVAVKWVEAFQTGLPMCIGGAIFGPLRFKPKQRQQYLQSYLPWAVRTGREAEFLLGVYWERRWEQNMEDLWRELKIQPFVKP